MTIARKPLVLMLAAFAADLLTFRVGALRAVAYADTNPVAQLMWTGGGFGALVILKLAAVGAVVLILRWRLRTRSPRLAYLVAAWIAVLGAVSNLPIR